MFQNVKPLDKLICEAFKYQDKGYEFLMGVTLIPFGLDELREVACHFPIAFTELNEKLIPVALLGKNKRGRIFNDQFEWLVNYTPKYIASYPFTVIRSKNSEGSDVLVPAYDADSKHLNDEGEKIIVDGQYSKEVRAKLGLATELVRSQSKVIELAHVAKEFGLLSQAGDKNIYYIDQERFSELSDKQFIELRHKHVLTLIYLAISSLVNLK